MSKAKIISFWSKAGHQNGITTNAIAFAVILSKLLPQKNILLIDTNTRFSLMQNYLNTNNNNKSLDTLIDRGNTNQLNKESFCDCLNEIKNHANLFSVNASNNHIFNNIRDMKNDINNILDIAKEIFPIIIIDNAAGQSELSNLVNNKAEIIVNVMRLNKHLLNNMKEANQLVEIKDKTRYLNVFNMYRDEIGISRNEISKTWDIENYDIIPFHEELDYQLNSDNFLKYLISTNDQYTVSIENILDKIATLLDFEIEELEDRKKKKEKRGLFKKWR